jgi:hypothetical protein
MPTHAELAARLLSDAAVFFENMGQSHPNLTQQMQTNAKVFSQMSELMTHNPTGGLDGKTFAEMAAQLLRDAALFFRALGDDNESVRDQMVQNADIFDHISTYVAKDPLGNME